MQQIKQTVNKEQNGPGGIIVISTYVGSMQRCDTHFEVHQRPFVKALKVEEFLMNQQQIIAMRLLKTGTTLFRKGVLSSVFPLVLLHLRAYNMI